MDDRRTPRELFEALEAEFGFTLDVAASDVNALCSRRFTLADDGLSQSWSGERVWCNPPYSDCGAWARKARLETQADCPLAVLLLPANRSEQAWWQEAIEPFRRDRGGVLEVRFLAGRLRFDVPAGSYSDPRGNRPPFGVCVVIFR